jgi:hypothetical protein
LSLAEHRDRKVSINANKKNKSARREKRATITAETSHKRTQETQETHRRSPIKETGKTSCASLAAIVSFAETRPTMFQTDAFDGIAAIIARQTSRGQYGR